MLNVRVLNQGCNVFVTLSKLFRASFVVSGRTFTFMSSSNSHKATWSFCLVGTSFIQRCKVKGHRRTRHEGLEGEESCSSTISLTSALDGGGRVVNTTLRPP
jgi:hypothetical protein